MTHRVDLCNSSQYLRPFCWSDYFITCAANSGKLGKLKVFILSVSLLHSSNKSSYFSDSRYCPNISSLLDCLVEASWRKHTLHLGFCLCNHHKPLMCNVIFLCYTHHASFTKESESLMYHETPRVEKVWIHLLSKSPLASFSHHFLQVCGSQFRFLWARKP